MKSQRPVRVLLLAIALASCLPDDTRPPPASVLVTVSAGGALASGAVVTADGWSVTFDRLLIALGNAELGGTTCTAYSDPRYRRIFSMPVEGPQKVNLLYGLGQCDFGFRVGRPSDDSLLGEGVTEADKERMRTPEGDAYTDENAGISLEVRGSALKGAVEKTFTFTFRPRVEYEKCAVPGPDGAVRGLALKAHEIHEVDIALHAEALFQDRRDREIANLRFDPFAAADDVYGDGDGAITLDELAEVPLDDIASAVRYADTEDEPETWTSLADYVYLGLAKDVARFRGEGLCSVELDLNR